MGPEMEQPDVEGIATTWTSEELSAINQVAAAVGEHIDLQPVLEVALDASLQALNLDMGWVRLFNQAGQLEVRVVRGLSQAHQRSLVLLESTEGVCGAALEKGESVVIHGAPADPADIYPVLRHHGLHSYLGVPLTLHGRYRGVLVTTSSTPFRFTPHQVQLVRLIAAQIAIGIEHALLHEEIEEERQRREDALQEANEGLERLSQVKDEFLSIVSHELKTPVTSIKVFSELATRRPEAVDPRFLETLGRQADRLVAMVNNLLDVSRLQLGRMSMEKSRVDLAALAAEFCDSYRSLFRDRVVTCLPLHEPVPVVGDPMRLEQVLSNLLDNALKFSPEGSRIQLRLSRREGKALLEVRDEGAGIAPEHLPHVFERFYKPGPQRSAYSGLGVGLYISKEIVERHGGRIWAESQPGRGSAFYVELPLAEGAKTKGEG
jgi:signal transduction histidine kinase